MNKKEFTIEEMREAMKKLFFEQEKQSRFPPVGRLSDTDKKRLRIVLGDMISSLGEDLYHIGDGCVTGIGGWNTFQEAVKKVALNQGLTSP